MSNMITIEEAIQSNNKVIGICFLVFIMASFVAWAFTIRRERRVKKLIRRAVAKGRKRLCHSATTRRSTTSCTGWTAGSSSKRRRRSCKSSGESTTRSTQPPRAAPA